MLISEECHCGLSGYTALRETLAHLQPMLALVNNMKVSPEVTEENSAEGNNVLIDYTCYFRSPKFLDQPILGKSKTNAGEF